jgi:N-ethylmaleimide reductase
VVAAVRPSDEIPETIEEYARGAKAAKAAGFDGGERHNANGWLPDQFLQGGTNRRGDSHGGSIENRTRQTV